MYCMYVCMYVRVMCNQLSQVPGDCAEPVRGLPEEEELHGLRTVRLRGAVHDHGRVDHTDE